MSPTSAPVALSVFGPQADPRLAAALDLAGVLAWERDFAAGTVQFSPHGAARFGLEGAAVSTAQWQARWHPDDAAQVLAIRDEPLQGELRFLRADQSWGVMVVTVVPRIGSQGTPVGQIGVGVDITERRRAALELRQQNERAVLAARGAGIGTWTLDLLTQQAQWDDQMWLLRGLPAQPGAPDRQHQLDFVHPEDRETVRLHVERAVAAGTVTQYEFRIIRPDGQVRWIASRSAPVVDEQGRAVRRIGVNWDVTDVREAERIRRETEIARGHSRAQAALLARMSHELRTPLNAVLGFVQLMLGEEAAGTGTGERRREQLEQIGKAGRELLQMVDQVLELSGKELDTPQATPLTSAPEAPSHTLIYIEDNAVNAMIVSELVRRRSDLQLHVVATGTEGVELALRLQPALVLLDMQLPDIDGYEVLRRMRAQPSLASTPVIALSANAMPQDIQRALDAGMLAYWTKPLDFKTFHVAIETMFGPEP